MTETKMPHAHGAATHDCCARALAADRHRAHHAHGSHGTAGSLSSLTTSATLHCLTGCAIGELAGLLTGVALGLDPWWTMALGTALGFVSGYSLGLRPLVQQGLSIGLAFKTIWLGETISIAAMELAMNFTDYHVGGVTAGSVLSMKFWLGYAFALPAGFLVAWPVNYWLLRSSLKRPCH